MTLPIISLRFLKLSGKTTPLLALSECTINPLTLSKLISASSLIAL